MFYYKSFLIHIISFILAIGLLAGCDEGAPTSSLDDSVPPNGASTNQAETEAASSEAQSGSSEVIPGQYLVVFKEGVGNVPDQAQNLAQQTGGTVFTSWTTVIQGFAIKGINENSAQAIENIPT